MSIITCSDKLIIFVIDIYLVSVKMMFYYKVYKYQVGGVY